MVSMTMLQRKLSAANFTYDTSFELDRTFDGKGQAQGVYIDYGLGRQCLVAFQPAVGDRLAYHPFDLALRRNPDLLQESPDAGIERVLIHNRLLWRIRLKHGNLVPRFRSS